VESIVEAAAILSLHDADNGIRLFKKAIKLEPTNVNALLRLAKICENMGKYDNALECYLKAI
jgi:tetratricopeptide (TPR) repeat protein